MYKLRARPCARKGRKAMKGQNMKTGRHKRKEKKQKCVKGKGRKKGEPNGGDENR